MDNKQLIPIDMDTIIELRLRGMYEKVDKLLKAYWGSKYKAKIQAKNEIYARDKEIKRHFHICTSIGCKNNPIPNTDSCKDCRDKKTISKKKAYKRMMKNKPSSLFIKCNYCKKTFNKMKRRSPFCSVNCCYNNTYHEKKRIKKIWF